MKAVMDPEVIWYCALCKLRHSFLEIFSFNVAAGCYQVSPEFIFCLELFHKCHVFISMHSHWWIQRPPPPQQDPILSFLHKFLPKSTRIAVDIGAPANEIGLPPSPTTGNPGSAPDSVHSHLELRTDFNTGLETFSTIVRGSLRIC